MKKVIYLFVGILTLMFAVSCDTNEEPVVVDPVAELIEVSFDINHFLPETAAKDDNKDPYRVPTCVDGLVPETVNIDIDGTVHSLKLVTLNGKLETEVIKLAATDYSIQSFTVMAADGITPLYASPVIGSYYQNLWDLDGVAKTFIVDKFEKNKITIDVLCYQPYEYEDFGFAWFQYAKYEVKTICFFGDICTKYFEAWHADGTAYAEQTTNEGYDFAAIFSVVVYSLDEDNNKIVVNDTEMNSNAGWYGEGSPLCIEYPDLIGADENYSFDIILTMPDGSEEIVHTETLAEGIMSDATADGFGGTDGVFDFVVGNCSYDDNDANLELPAWIPVPKNNVKFQISQTGSGEEGYVRAKFDFLGAEDGMVFGDLNETDAFAMWCAEKLETIYYGPWYEAKVYSSLGLGTTAMPPAMQALPWNELNWVMNNKDGFSNAEVQDAVWYLIGQGGGSNNALAQAAAGHSTFEPTVGDWAILSFDADGLNPNVAMFPKVQLMIVRVDP